MACGMKGTSWEGYATCQRPHLDWMAPHPTAGFTVNGQLIGNKASSPGQHESTYFGRLGISSPTSDFQLEVTPQNITLNPSSSGSMFSWRDQAVLQKDG